ncbi:hypothetical protein ABIB25_002789 [Nakamurella sp. UYEF19]|uniref:hypothetical protein n=1 Tax=Nakamurella sp. UYEF19 TaxID=1756392 RepID=UPI0033973044
MVRSSTPEWATVGADVRIRAFGIPARMRYVLLMVGTALGAGSIVVGGIRHGWPSWTGGLDSLFGLVFAVGMTMFFVLALPLVMSRRTVVLGPAGVAWFGPGSRSVQILWTDVAAVRSTVVVQHPLIGVRRRKGRLLSLDIHPVAAGFGGRHPEVQSFRDLPGAEGFYRITVGPAVGRKTRRLDDALRRHAAASYRPSAVQDRP